MKARRYLLIGLITVLVSTVYVQSEHEIDHVSDLHYTTALETLRLMLIDSIEPSFKQAVYVTENAFFENSISLEAYDKEISTLVNVCNWIAENTALKYDGEDKKQVEKWAAIFITLTQDMFIPVNDTSFYLHKPFAYDFDDIWGEKDWSKQFVFKLMSERSGNCHSLPFLYKILAEELGVDAWLAMAPHHIYIKLKSEEWGWYNTELTSATFPMDAWITASSYINFDAIRSKMYMDTLSLKQSIALCAVDLAEGYKHKFGGNNLDFILDCTDLALTYDPTFANALLLKAETLKKQFEKLMQENTAQYPSDVFTVPEAKDKFLAMERTYDQLVQSGYQPMPKEMYLQWLTELKEGKEKYLNRKIMPNLIKD